MSFERRLWSLVVCGCVAPFPLLTLAQTTQPTPYAQAMGGMPSAASQPVISNADIIKMVQAGMSDSTITLLIQRGPDRFDTSPDAMIALKRAGASEAVITAMLTAPQAGAAATMPSYSNGMPQQPAAAGMPMATTPSTGSMPSSAAMPSMGAPQGAMGGMPGAASMNQMPTTGGMPGATTMPSTTSSMGGMPGATSMNQMPTTSGTPGATTTASTTASMGALPPAASMNQTAAGMNGMPGTAYGPGATAPATGIGGAVTSMGTQAVQNYGGAALPTGTTALVQQTLQALTGHIGSASVKASGIPVADLSPILIQAAIYSGTQTPGQPRGLMVWDTGSSGNNPFIRNLETVAAQEAKLPANMTLPDVQRARAPSGFGVRILTPTEWLAQLAGDNAARGVRLDPNAVPPDMLRPVLHVLGYYSAPGTVSAVNNVTLADATDKKTLQPSATAPFFAQGVMGLAAEFPLDALAQLRQQDREFEVVVTATNGRSKTFKIKKQQFAALP